MCTLIDPKFLIVSACFQYYPFVLFNEREQTSVFNWMRFLFLDELLAEREKYKGVSDELDMTLNELSGY